MADYKQAKWPAQIATPLGEEILLFRKPPHPGQGTPFCQECARASDEAQAGSS